MCSVSLQVEDNERLIGIGLDYVLKKKIAEHHQQC